MRDTYLILITILHRYREDIDTTIYNMYSIVLSKTARRTITILHRYREDIDTTIYNMYSIVLRKTARRTHLFMTRINLHRLV